MEKSRGEKTVSQDDVRAYYARVGEREWDRLRRGEGTIEFTVTCEALSSFLPSNGRILDIGGGPGRYAIWLARRGYRIVLGDLSPELVALARAHIDEAGVAQQVEDIVVADARDLARWGDASFDAVVSHGPFYHLPESTVREQAATELSRVLRPEVIAFVALMPRYAFLRRTLVAKDERSHLTQPGFLSHILDDGIFLNDIPGRFTGGWGVRPEEVGSFFERHGLEMLTLLGCQGIAAGLEDAVAELAATDPVAHRAIIDVILRTANDPSILGLCSHLLYVGQKRS